MAKSQIKKWNFLIFALLAAAIMGFITPSLAETNCVESEEWFCGVWQPWVAAEHAADLQGLPRSLDWQIDEKSPARFNARLIQLVKEFEMTKELPEQTAVSELDIYLTNKDFPCLINQSLAVLRCTVHYRHERWNGVMGAWFKMDQHGRPTTLQWVQFEGHY